MLSRAAVAVSCIAILASTAFAATDDFRRRLPDKTLAQDSSYKTTDVTAEIQFGRDVAARILGRYKYHDNESVNRYLNLVGKAVALHAGRPELEYHFALIQADSVNAYAAPGGYVFVTTGALAQMQDEAELAAVLAHEVAHVTERHVVKALNIRGRDESTEAGLARLVAGSTDAARVAFAQAVDSAVELLFDKGLKKQDELDADRLAVVLLANTGYDPSALKRYFNRVQGLTGEETRVVNATHPPFSDRLAALDQVMSAEGFSSLKNPTAKERFLKHVKTK